MQGKYKILYVEDEVIIRGIVSELLELEGYEVREAGDGEEAMEILEQEKFNLLITDLRMPRMDGAQLLFWCRKNNMHFPVIFVTANCDLLPIEETATKDCCVQVLMKPVGMDDLLKHIDIAKQRDHAFHCNGGKAYKPNVSPEPQDFPGQHYY